MAKLTTEEFIEAIKELSVLELNDLVKACEEEFGVSAAAGVVVAGTFFKIVLYICVIVLLFWVGKASYQFGHDVFNQQAMSPGEGQEVTVVIKEDTSLYKIAKTLQKKGLVKSATVFYVQERLSTYHGKLQAGTYLLSTAYTPNRIMGILAGDDEQEGVSDS